MTPWIGHTFRITTPLCGGGGSGGGDGCPLAIKGTGMRIFDVALAINLITC